jgi:enoyl-[acyl-carrier protein] reductase I
MSVLEMTMPMSGTCDQQGTAGQQSANVLKGMRALVIGVANEHSIAWGCAKEMHRAGAEIALSYLNEKARQYVEPLAREVDARVFLPLNVQNPAELDALFNVVEAEWGRIDILVHSIAFAPHDALSGRVTDCPRDGFLTAMEVSCWSLLDMAHRSERLMRNGGTILTMSYLGANAVIENYGVMGPVKAALEASVRYLASELGPKNIRVHAISPGPLATRAASGIPAFDQLMDRVAHRAPERRLVTIEEVGAAAVFLASPYARGMTGGTVFVDAGYHILG